MEGKQPTSHEEIDLAYLFRPVARVIRQTGQGIFRHFSRIRKNLLLFFTIVIIITLAGFSLRYVIPPAYKTEGIFISHVLPGKYCELLIGHLNSHNNIPLLAEQLHLSPGIAGDIRSLSLTPLQDSFGVKTRDSTSYGFMVQVVLRSMDNLDSIQKGLAGYFENNELSLRRKEARKRSLLALQSDLETKLLSLDSLKTLVNSSVVPRSTGQGIILGEPIDPVKVYIAQIKYYKEKLDIDEQLANPNSIETLQPLLRLTESNYPSYNHLLLYSFGVALLLGVLFTPVIGKRK